MNRRKTWAAALIAVAVAAILAAWVVVGPSDDSAATQPATGAATPANTAAEAPRRADAAIPFSPSRANAPTADTPHVAHKTAPAPLLPHGSLRTALPAMLLLAHGKPPNAEAAMAAYDILIQCKRMASNPPAQPDPQAPDCSGVTEADWKNAPQLLKLAAEMGHERAQLTIAQRLVGLGRDPDELASTRDELVQMNDKARQYLNSLAERGNVDGMWFLGESLRAGDIAEQDLVMAYAYKYAVARAGGYPSTIDAELARLESQLNAQDQARARDFANRLIDRCCARR